MNGRKAMRGDGEGRRGEARNRGIFAFQGHITAQQKAVFSMRLLPKSKGLLRRTMVSSVRRVLVAIPCLFSFRAGQDFYFNHRHARG
jgi:hypothetical protein